MARARRSPVTIIRNNKKSNEFKLTGTFTMGQLLAMHEACRLYGETASSVAMDVHSFLSTAFYDFKQENPSEGRGDGTGPKNSELY